MQVTLVMFKADGQRSEFPLTKPLTVLGRKHTCELRIPIPSVSREHCQVELRGDSVVLRDLGSSNGTVVNDKPVKERQLEPGDVITIGPVHFVVTIDGEPAEIEPIKTVLPGAGIETADTPEDAMAASDALAESDDLAVAVMNDESEEVDISLDEVDVEHGSQPVPSVKAGAKGEDQDEDGLDDDIAVLAEDAETGAREDDDGLDIMDLGAEEDASAESAIGLTEEEDESAAQPSSGPQGGEDSAIRITEQLDESAVNLEAAASDDAKPPPKPKPKAAAASDEDDDPFADLALDELSEDDDNSLAELAEAFPEDEEDEK